MSPLIDAICRTFARTRFGPSSRNEQWVVGTNRQNRHCLDWSGAMKPKVRLSNNTDGFPPNYYSGGQRAVPVVGSLLPQATCKLTARERETVALAPPGVRFLLSGQAGNYYRFTLIKHVTTSLVWRPLAT